VPFGLPSFEGWYVPLTLPVTFDLWRTVLASANVLESANAAASAIVASFILLSFMSFAQATMGDLFDASIKFVFKHRDRGRKARP
jgi:hypothetical protein